MTPPRSILESDKQALQNKVKHMYHLARNALDNAMSSLQNNDTELAARVVNEDSAINKIRHQIEDLGISTIALQQPVAGDLRILMADIYISMELERIADHATAIAKIVQQLDQVPAQRYLNPITEIAGICVSMMEHVMQAYQDTNARLARDVAGKDDEIDAAEQEFNQLILSEICKQPQHSTTCTYLLWLTHNLERIGDRITNIAERVVYMATNETPDLND